MYFTIPPGPAPLWLTYNVSYVERWRYENGTDLLQGTWASFSLVYSVVSSQASIEAGDVSHPFKIL